MTAAVVLAVLAALRSPALNGGLALSATLAQTEVPGPLRLTLLGPTLTTLAAVLLPATILGVASRLDSLRPGHLIAGAVLVGIPFIAIATGPFLGQTWTSAGLTGNDVLAGLRDEVIPTRLWSMSEELARLGAILFAGLVLRWAQRALGDARAPRALLERLIEVGRPTSGLFLAFIAAYAGVLAGAIVLQVIPLDRYLYPVVPVAAVLVLAGSRRVWAPGRSQVLAHAALLWLGVSALAITANSFAYDTARWREGGAAVAAGYAPGTIDAGYEWVGDHSKGHVNDPPADYGLTRYANELLAAYPCAVVSNSPLADESLTLLRADLAAYQRYLLVGPLEPLYLYGSTDPGCRQ